uniref:G-protein coupled receptors family 2 profile 2 domain-containing protein n=1 Tax=Corethron hystrix TaxID=216773 RepID=A0A7S1C116_9STRA|mmetsp:Transcript_7380/g.15985  ORF Transcript_7380/g.15985 Transcript_7380/m.15985 type:complete len:350 (+) Transcript_7380:172-1221(+)
MVNMALLTTLARISGSLSFIGSALMIGAIIGTGKWRKCMQFRLLGGLAAFDLLSSGSYAFNALPGLFHEENETFFCTLQGFMMQLFIGSAIYNLSLKIYYFMSVIKRTRAEKYEIYMHASAIILGLGFAIAAAILKLFNPTSAGWCWIAAFPSNCGGDSRSGDRSDCIYGSNAYIYRLAFYYIPLWVIIILVTVIMIAMTYQVRNIEKGGAAYRKCRRSSMTSLVAWRSFYYVFVFYLTCTFISITRFQELIGGKPSDVVLILAVIFDPLQGFFNCIIFFWPFLSEHCGNFLQAIRGYILFAFGTAHASNDDTMNKSSEEGVIKDDFMQDPAPELSRELSDVDLFLSSR